MQDSQEARPLSQLLILILDYLSVRAANPGSSLPSREFHRSTTTSRVSMRICLHVQADCCGSWVTTNDDWFNAWLLHDSVHHTDCTIGSQGFKTPIGTIPYNCFRTVNFLVEFSNWFRPISKNQANPGSTASPSVSFTFSSQQMRLLLESTARSIFAVWFLSHGRAFCRQIQFVFFYKWVTDFDTLSL